MQQRLATVMVTVLVLAGLGLLVPAHAAPAPTIAASDDVVASGTRVTLRGKVPGDPRTRVVLQVRAPSGWRAVASVRTSARRSYRFRTTPADGFQRYRVLVPRRPGSPARSSRAIPIRVEWQPTLAVTQAAHRTAPGGAVTTTVTGTSARLAGAALRREVQGVDGVWRLAGTVTVGADGGWGDSFAATDGEVVRFVAPASGARLAAHTPPFAVDGSWTPTVSLSATPVDQGRMTVSGSVPGVPEGTGMERQSVVAGVWTTEAVLRVLPDGRFADAFDAGAGRSYRYLVPPAGARRAAASATFVAPTPPPGPEPDPEPDPDPDPEPEPEPEPETPRIDVGRTTSISFEGGVAERTFVVTLTAGSTLTYDGPAWLRGSLTSPSGEQVDGFTTESGRVTVRVAESGDHTLRLENVHLHSYTADVTLSNPVRVETALDATGVDLSAPLPGQLVDVVFDAPAGGLVSEHAPGATPFEPPRGSVSLLDPDGNEVPRLGSLVRRGANWLLPDRAGPYVLRITPGWSDPVDRDQQTVLTGVQTTAALDGQPGHVVLDHPGRVALVRTTVPAGLEVRLSHTGEHLQEEVWAPDGTEVWDGSLPTDLRTTQAGTYLQLVAYDDRPVDAYFYASTPMSLDVAESSTAYDTGAAPDRVVHARIPVWTDRMFAIEVLDEHGLCARHTEVVEGGDLVDWGADLPDHPSVLRTNGGDELVVALHPCQRTGTIRVQDVEIVEAEAVSTSTVDGVTTTTSRATLAAPVPGRLMIVGYDADYSWQDRVTLAQTGWRFPADASLRVAMGGRESSVAENYGSWAQGELPFMFPAVRGPQLVYFYAGPHAVGELDVEIEVTGD